MAQAGSARFLTAASRHEIAPCECACVSDRLDGDTPRKELRQSRLRPAARSKVRLRRVACVWIDAPISWVLILLGPEAQNLQNLRYPQRS